ncbi:MAG: hypothetical protein NC115_09015 [Bacteroidales bacterium]|nr:hypothetical protein [Bacteroidales bacterium]
MKKVYAFITVLLLSTATIVALTAKVNDSDDILKANAKALAETAGNMGPMCSKTGTRGSHYMKLCSTCASFGNYEMDVVAFCRSDISDKPVIQ